MNILDEIEELRKEIKRLEQEVAQAYNDGYSDGWNNAMEDCDNRNWGANTMRTATNKLIEMMDQGLISPQVVAEMALAYMSEYDVADMMRANDILDEDLSDYETEELLDDGDGQPDEAQEWYSYDPDCWRVFGWQVFQKHL